MVVAERLGGKKVQGVICLDYETGKALELMNAKLDMILENVMPVEEEKKDVKKEEGKKGQTS